MTNAHETVIQCPMSHYVCIYGIKVWVDISVHRAKLKININKKKQNKKRKSCF